MVIVNRFVFRQPSLPRSWRLDGFSASLNKGLSSYFAFIDIRHSLCSTRTRVCARFSTAEWDMDETVSAWNALMSTASKANEELARRNSVAKAGCVDRRALVPLDFDSLLLLPFPLLERAGEQEAKILDCLKAALHKVWESSRYTIPVNQGQLVQARLTDGAFTLQDTPARSPPAPPTSSDASRVGVVTPAPVEDLVGEEAAPAKLNEGLHASGRAAKAHASEAEGTAAKRMASSDVVEGGKQCARDSDSGAGQEQSPDPVEGGAVDGQPPTSQPLEEGEGGSQDSASTPAIKGTGSNADADEGTDKGRGLAAGAYRTPTRTVSRVSAPAEGASGAPNVPSRAGGSPCPTLAYDMQSILGGCRKASRLKRKRDARNASADSFSAKLSGCGTKDRDSMAAARAFSRVLHKVGRDF